MLSIERLIPSEAYATRHPFSEVTEQGVMSLSGHRTPEAARGYVKRTERQREIAARRRMALVEANETGARVRIEPQRESQNGTKANS